MKIIKHEDKLYLKLKKNDRVIGEILGKHKCRICDTDVCTGYNYTLQVGGATFTSYCSEGCYESI